MSTLKESSVEKRYMYKSHLSRAPSGEPIAYSGFYLFTTGWTPTQSSPELDYTWYQFGKRIYNQWTDVPNTEGEANTVSDSNDALMTEPPTLD